MIGNVNHIVFVDFLKACTKKKDICRGSTLHAQILQRGLLHQDHPYIASALINMYAKCGVISKATQVLEEISVRNVVHWNALMAGYAQEGHVQGAILCLSKMQHDGLSPDTITFILILKACAKIKAIDVGEQIHEEIMEKNLLEKDIMLGNTLVDMYAKCGMLAKAKKVLEQLPYRNVVSWNALISGYAQQEKGHEALHYFQSMQREGISPDAVTFVCVLQACGKTRCIEKGKQIHDVLVARGLLGKDIVLGNALVDMYSKCRALTKARKVLEELENRNVASWNALIAGYAQQGQGHEALSCFEQMEHEGFCPDAVTFICILKACSKARAIEMGKQIHDKILNGGFLEKDSVLGNALVDMYAKCGVLEKAKEVLEDLPIQDAASWNALISGYEHQGKCNESLKCFDQMQREGLSPDAVTFICALKACGSVKAIEKGKQIHEEIVHSGLLGQDVVLGSALVDMYAKCGMVKKAQQVLEKLPVRNAISWCALIAGYAQQGQHHEALNSFEQMQCEGLSPDVVTFICILKACCNAGSVDKGTQIHEAILSRRLLQKDILLGNALVDMYAKCGVPVNAHKVLEELPDRDVVSWNALIAGYAQQGQGREALNCFSRMLSEGICPSEITFSCVLSACSHSGLVDEAQIIFGNMTRKHGITPNLEHHVCMVVVFGCAGEFDKAMSVIKAMPSAEYAAVWVALLGSCRKWGNLKLGILAFDQVLQLDNCCVEAYVLMANIFAAFGRVKDADNVQSVRLKYAPSEESIMCGLVQV